MKKMIITGLFCSLALAGCNTANFEKAIAETGPVICKTITTAHAAFQGAVLTGNVSESLQKKEATAWGVAQPYCANGGYGLTSSDLILLSAQQIAILLAQKTAQKELAK